MQFTKLSSNAFRETIPLTKPFIVVNLYILKVPYGIMEKKPTFVCISVSFEYDNKSWYIVPCCSRKSLFQKSDEIIS